MTLNQINHLMRSFSKIELLIYQIKWAIIYAFTNLDLMTTSKCQKKSDR